jgi:hypothetical protein
MFFYAGSSSCYAVFSPVMVIGDLAKSQLTVFAEVTGIPTLPAHR